MRFWRRKNCLRGDIFENYYNTSVIRYQTQSFSLGISPFPLNTPGYPPPSCAPANWMCDKILLVKLAQGSGEIFTSNNKCVYIACTGTCLGGLDYYPLLVGSKCDTRAHNFTFFCPPLVL